MPDVAGPLWTDGDGGRYAGRFPLAVERHAMAQVGHLLPGITTVTPHARYYTLHATVFAEARARGLDEAATRRLLRRAEVVVGAVSMVHGRADPAAHAGMRSPHGSDHLGPRLDHGADIDALSADGAYAQAGWGFWGPYVASEFAMGLLATEGKKTIEGPNADHAALRAGFDGLFDLASRPALTTDQLTGASHLCICQTRNSADGLMLQRVLIPESATAMHHDDRRAQTLRMLLRLTDLTAHETTPKLDHALAFSEVREDPDLRAFDVFPAWTGVVLRTFTVAGWRNLWQHLVASIEGFMKVDALGDLFADALPSGSVRDFVDSRPPGMDGARLLGAEFAPEVEALGVAERALSRLVIGAGRSGRLDERTQAYFQGQRDEQYQQLTPSWLQDRLTEWSDRPLRDFAIWLTHQLVARAERIALMKASFDYKAGRFRIPTRVFVRDGYLFKDSDEAGGGVALRWGSAFDVMSGVGFVARADGRWVVTDAGRAA
ncbi:hypothetical protein [Nocardioides sp. KR10-350]|uniref:hypothetical protein n=1 Tax=Nocardioides cheoyonin TaxID=3156615 RepID=UPI0032B42960